MRFEWWCNQVVLECGKGGTQLMSVSEPSTCAYELVLSTPLVCHAHSMLVYPVLPPHLRHQWDSLQGQLNALLITQQVPMQSLHSFLMAFAAIVCASIYG